MSYYIPIAVIVISNIMYQICLKSAPENINAFASLSVTYMVAAVGSFALYFLTVKNGNLINEYSHINLMPVLLGISLIGLEGGFIWAFKAGWAISTTTIVQSSILSAALIFVGFFLYGEAITFNKVLGIVICFIGLIFINK